MSQLFFVGDIYEHGGSSGVEVSTGGVEPLTVRGTHGGFVEGCPEGVEGDVNGVGVSAAVENISHDLSRVASNLFAELGKVFNPVLDKGGLDDFNLHLFNDVTNFSAHGVGLLLKKFGKVGSYGGIDEDCLIQVGKALGVGFEGGDGSHDGVLEHTERVTLGEELVDSTTGEGPFEQEHDVLNHVLVGDKVHEGGHGFDGLSAKVLELIHELREEREIRAERGDKQRQ